VFKVTEDRDEFELAEMFATRYPSHFPRIFGYTLCPNTILDERDIFYHVAMRKFADRTLLEHCPAREAEGLRVLFALDHVSTIEARCTTAMEHGVPEDVVRALGNRQGIPMWVAAFEVLCGDLDVFLHSVTEDLLVRVAPRVVADVIGAVRSMFAEGVAHRDVTLANVLLRPSGGSLRGVLHDFGRATRGAQAATVQTDCVNFFEVLLASPFGMTPGAEARITASRQLVQHACDAPALRCAFGFLVHRWGA